MKHLQTLAVVGEAGNMTKHALRRLISFSFLKIPEIIVQPWFDPSYAAVLSTLTTVTKELVKAWVVSLMAEPQRQSRQ